MTGRLSAKGFPAANDDVDIVRIELDTAADPASLLRGDQRGAAAGEGIEHDTAAVRAVLDGVGHQCHRLNGGVHGKFFQPAWPERVDPRILPDVGAIPPLLPEAEVVDVRLVACLEDE